MNSPKHLKNTLTERVTDIITESHLLKEGDKVIVGVSGGADSIALLYILHAVQINLELIAVYVDHGLRPAEVPAEIQTISLCCKTLQVPLIVESVDVHSFAGKEKRSIEDSARTLRYETFHKLRTLHSAQAVAVGHNADDQVEEFFLRAIRGSSRKSLSGMKLQNGTIIRPLLYLRKVELVEYLENKNIPWCLDSSNFNRDYLRNRVRLDLLPILRRDFNDSIDKTTLQNMDILREEERYLDLNTAAAFEECTSLVTFASEGMRGEQLQVQRDHFLRHHPAIRRRILEKCCWKMQTKPSYEQICALMELIDWGTTGAEIHLPAGLRAEKTPQALTFSWPLPPGQSRGSVQPEALLTKNIPGLGTYFFNALNKKLILEEVVPNIHTGGADEGMFVDLATIDFPLLCRSSLPGERFHPLGAPGTKKISRFYNDRKVPAKKRASWPVLVSKDRVIALPGLQVSESHKVTSGTTTALKISWVSIENKRQQTS